MLQMTKKFLCAVLLAVGLQAAWGFSLLGPMPTDAGGESWQIPAIGYGLGYTEFSDLGGEIVWLGDIGGPHNWGEGYRRNVPVLYYSCDANFLDYFGTTGLTNVQAAFEIMNAVTNVSSYSADLSEFPQVSQQYNYTAQSLFLTDLKSVTLHLLVEQMGLADPERFTWTLHDRWPGSKCPLTTIYSVVQRNFDPLNESIVYSPYVNGVLYSYEIEEICSGTLPLAQTVPFPVSDPDAYGQYTSVAANNYRGLQIGGYYKGLTRDDAAGLRYLLASNNIVTEALPAGNQLFTITTNTTSIGQELFPPTITLTNTAATNYMWYYYYEGDTNGFYGYGDLGYLTAFARTNDPATLQTNFPGLVISSVIKTNGYATNISYSYYYTNPIGSSYLDTQLVLKTNYTTVFQWYYLYQFANVVTNHYITNKNLLVTATIAPPIGSSYLAAAVTNYLITYTPQVGGDFFVLPAAGYGVFNYKNQTLTNVCPLDIGSVVMTNVGALTNYISLAITNLPVTTNTVTTTATNNTTQYTVTYFTNYQYVIHPVTCGYATNSVGMRPGIEHVQFVYAPYDGILGQNFTPITNSYSEYADINGQLVLQHFQKIVTTPDINLTAQDLATGGASICFNGTVERTINYDSTQVLTGERGPGIINSPSTLIYNKVGPLYNNGPVGATNAYLYEFDQTSTLQWASFDDSTNAPILYPNTASISNLQYQLLVRVTPASLADGTNGVVYPAVTFAASGGAFTSPFNWSATGLPAGLSISSSGLLSGKPAASGTFDFTLQLIDSLGRSVQWTYIIIIH
jgi:hypothetical protein